MNILVLGSGGREHASTSLLVKSNKASKVYVMPGNPGTALIARNVDINPMSNQEVLEFCITNNVELVIPGSEVYLQNGIADVLEGYSIHCFGPKKKAAMLESSKEFAKDLMKKYQIPTAKYEVFDNYELALKYLDEKGVPIVIKYDGLAGGKGVVVAKEYSEAKEALYNMLSKKVFGEAKVVIEEFLEGPEFSLMCFVDNGQVIPMPISQDHKRLLDGDLGPNTGGMGIYSSVPIIPKEVVLESIRSIMEKTIAALENEGISYTGFLYGGLMYTKEGPKVIEFNARFGDPEAEVILPRLKTDLIDIILMLREHKKPVLEWTDEYILGVVLASKGYPNTYQKGYEIKNIDQVENIYHMGTIFKDNKYLTNGGRVLLVFGKGNTLLEARNKAYENVSKIECENLIYRNDIGYQSL